MIDLTLVLADIRWPIAILIAWFFGEIWHMWTRLPRMCAYALAGFVLAPSQSGFLPQSQSATMLLLANIAFGLILFECGYRINLRWMRANPWMIATSFAEAVFTFAAVYFLIRWFSLPVSMALLLAALSMATSPAALIRVVNEQNSSGQVTERVLHLSALNCVLAVFVYKIVVGLVVFRTSGSLWEASYSSLFDLAVSVMLGVAFGFAIPGLLRYSKRTSQDSTLAFTVSVICVVALAHSLKLSPVLAALTFGLFARHRRIVMSSSQRGFGALGDLLSVLLFVFIAATLEWKQVLAGIGLGLGIITVRQIAKIAGNLLFARIGGISWRKGFLTGLASTPFSAFVILVMEQTRYLGISLVDQFAPLAAVALTLEIFAPVLIQRALIWAHEVPESREYEHAP